MFDRKIRTQDKVAKLDRLRSWLCYKGLYPAYSHVNSKGITYHLNFKNVSLRAGKIQTIYYFSKDKRPEKTILPKSFTVHENPRNGFLTIKTPSMRQAELEGPSCEDD